MPLAIHHAAGAAARWGVGCLVVAVSVLALAPTTSHAHALSSEKARKAAVAESLGLAEAVNSVETPDGDVFRSTAYGIGRCSRGGAHGVRCPITVIGEFVFLDGPVGAFRCDATAVVRYRNHRSRTPTAATTDRVCDVLPAPLPAVRGVRLRSFP